MNLVVASAACAVVCVSLSACVSAALVSTRSSVPPQGPELGTYTLPMTMVRLEVFRSKTDKYMFGELSDTSVTKLPDPAQTYRVTWDQSVASKDTITIETDAKGLLKDVQSSTEDRTIDIAEAAIALAARIASGNPTAGPTVNFASIGATSSDVELYRSAWFDPTNPNIKIATQQFFAGTGYRVCLGDTAEARPGLNVCSTGTIAPSAPSANSPSDASSGLQYRLAVPYILKIQEATPNCAEGQLVDSCWHDVFSRIVMAENRSAIYSIPIERAAFVTNTYHLTFTDGALTKNIVTKPSELLALMRLPLDVVDTILDIPFKQMERLTTRETKEQALYTAQKSAIDAQKEAITANRAFMDYMAANAKAAGGTTAPGVMQDPGHTAPQ